MSVTIYRNPDRAGATTIDLGWPGGYALITEQRTVTIPAGRAVIRFEGVAGGILPESAIVTGLPDGVREKNLDADLLSPRSLYARSLGRPVTLIRTQGGRTTEERAIIRSGPDGAAIVETKEGFRAANCETGAQERLAYDSIPEGLSARPTLSVETDSSAARQVTLTLSYLAWGFDWQANYVATMRPDGRTADLFAWVTLANSDITSFVDAETMVVAGRLEGDVEANGLGNGAAGLALRCFFRPVADRSGGESFVVVDAISSQDLGALPDRNLVQALKRVPGVAMNRFATQEDLGDLKLYRVPHRTTVAANGQKQVALLDRQGVAVDVVHRVRVRGDEAGEVTMLLRAQNRKEKGLGVALPAGPVALFEPRGDSRLLIGENGIDDKAVGEEVEIEFAAATQVVATLAKSASGAGWNEYSLAVTNANPWPVGFEADLVLPDGARLQRASVRLGRKYGRELWAVEVPATGTATLRYRVKLARR